MRIVFVMDPIETVLLDEDTTFALMLEAQTRGHRVDHCLITDVYLERHRICAKIRQATLDRKALPPIALASFEEVSLHEVDAVFVRKDPPFDDSYLWLTLVLEHLRGDTFVVNDSRGLREANEKLYACFFSDVVPETLVTADKERIFRFVAIVGGKAVIKPIDGHGGEGVFALSSGDLNMNAAIETATRHGKRLAMVQRFLPEVEHGDKRILLLDGEPLGAILRIPKEGELRSNIHVGGRVVGTTISDRDRRILAAVSPRLRRDGLWFVGLDVIGDWLTEINVTSPTGIQQMSRLSGENVERRVITWLEHHPSP